MSSTEVIFTNDSEAFASDLLENVLLVVVSEKRTDTTIEVVTLIPVINFIIHILY